MLAFLARPWILALAFSSPLLADGPFRELSFNEALAASLKEERAVFIDFYTTWCPPCKQLDEVTWKDERVIQWLKDNTVALKIDAEVEAELAQRFAVGAYPTLLFVGSDGKELGRFVGYKGPDEFLSEAPAAMKGETESDRVRKKLEEKPNDFGLRMDLGSALHQEGRFEEALAEYIWCYDKGIEYNPNYSAVRNSYLLGDFTELGYVYPPATTALLEREQRAREKLLSGEGGFEEAADVGSICRALGQNGKVLELWDELAEGGKLSSQIRIALFNEVLNPLLSAGRYAEVLNQIGDVSSYLKQEIEGYYETISMDEANESLKEHMLRSCLIDSAKIYEALLGVQDERAPAYAKDVLAFNSTAQAYSRLVRAAAKAKSWEAARELLTQGYASADSKGEKLLRLAERRLPKAERLPRDKK